MPRNALIVPNAAKHWENFLDFSQCSKASEETLFPNCSLEEPGNVFVFFNTFKAWGKTLLWLCSWCSIEALEKVFQRQINMYNAFVANGRQEFLFVANAKTTYCLHPCNWSKHLNKTHLQLM